METTSLNPAKSKYKGEAYIRYSSGHFHNTVQGRICIGYTSSTSAKTVFVLVEINRPQYYTCGNGPQLEVKYLTILWFVTIISHNMNEKSLNYRYTI